MQGNEILFFFAKYIENELGIVYADHNYFQLQNRLEEIAKLLGVASVEELYKMGRVGIAGAFKHLLLDVATNNETSFFRDINVFRAIENVVLPSVLPTLQASEKMMIWSAASSSGQEAISTAITMIEWSKRQMKAFDFHIHGTDISERILQRAQKAEYSQLEVQRGLPAPLMIKYFKKDQQDRWTANVELTGKMDFKKLNLKESFYFAKPFHLVLCRNVLIYQSVQGKIDILKKVSDVLVPGGYLILGSGESLLGLSDGYELASTEGAVIYRRKLALKKSA